MVSMPSFAKELEFGRRIARQAGELALRSWGKGIGFEAKSDDSPVTVADRENEKLLAGLIAAAFPDDGLMGEEGTNKEAKNGRRWIVDPIDGTRDFVRGNPFWAVLIGFEEAGEVRAGFAYLPALDQLYSAATGEGAFRNDARIRVSQISSPAQAVLCVNGLNATYKLRFGPWLPDWMRQFWAVRSVGGCVDAMMVASGQADLWIEPTAKPWDLAPLKIIAEEAGGRFFNFDGGASIYGGNCIICTPGLEAEARRLVGA